MSNTCKDVETFRDGVSLSFADDRVSLDKYRGLLLILILGLSCLSKCSVLIIIFHLELCSELKRVFVFLVT